MSMNDAILLASIGLMLYGLVLCMLNGLDFWLSPIGNVIGAIGVSTVAGAALPITGQDKGIIWVSTVLALYWFTRGKRDKPTAPRGKVAFDQVFQTVAVPAPPPAVVEPDPVVEDEPEEVEEVEPVVENDDLPVFTLGG